MSEGTSALNRILERGSLRIPVQFHEPPSTGTPPEFYIDPDTGKPHGIAPIVGGLMARDLGVELECVDMPWPNHIPAMLAGEVDVCPKHTNTPERALRVDFCNGRLTQYRVTLLVRKEDSARPRDYFNDPNIKIGSWHGSSTTQVAKRSFPHATVSESPTPRDDLQAGKFDAICGDSVTTRLLELNPSIALLRNEGQLVVLSREYVHPSVRPGDPHFLNWVNNWHEYHSAQGTIDYWCNEWWESFMADRD